MTIKVDVHEPTDISRFLDGAYDIELTDNISAGVSDYWWTGEALGFIPNHDGSYNHERKTMDDVSGGLDEIEEQVRKVVQRNPNTVHRLIIEGVWEPAPSGIIVYRKKQGVNAFFGGQKGTQPQLAKRINGWIAAASDYIQVFQTSSMAHTSILLGNLYAHDQKTESERTIFRRYMKDLQWNPNPQVMRLMGMAGNDTGLGAVRCENLIAKFGTAWNVIHASPNEIAAVPGIGVHTAVTFLQRIGRTDV